MNKDSFKFDYLSTYTAVPPIAYPWDQPQDTTGEVRVLEGSQGWAFGLVQFHIQVRKSINKELGLKMIPYTYASINGIFDKLLKYLSIPNTFVNIILYLNFKHIYFLIFY